MSNFETSPWAAPAEKAPVSIESIIADSNADDADLDDMKMAHRVTPEVPAVEAPAGFSEVPAPYAITMSPEQFSSLSTADPESAEVADFMQEHALEFGGDLAVVVEGVGAKVVTVDKEDFFTSVRSQAEVQPDAPAESPVESAEALTPSEILHEKASEDLAEETFDMLEVAQLENGVPVEVVAPIAAGTLGAESARNIVAIDTEPSVAEATPETPEKPAIDIDSELIQLERGAAEIDNEISKLEIADEGSIELNRLADSVDESAYTSEMSAAVLNRVTEDMRDIHTRVDAILGGRITAEITEPLEALLHTKYPNELSDLPGVTEAKQTISEKVDSLEAVVRQLDILRTNPGMLDGGELRGLAQRLRVVAEDNYSLRMSAKIQDTVLRLHS